MNRAIGHEKLSAARMVAPKVKRIAIVFVLARSKRIGAIGTGWRAEGRPILGNAHKAVGGAKPLLADTGVPPAETVIGTGRTLANHQSIARAIGDGTERNARIEVQKAIMPSTRQAAYAQV